MKASSTSDSFSNRADHNAITAQDPVTLRDRFGERQPASSHEEAASAFAPDSVDERENHGDLGLINARLEMELLTQTTNLLRVNCTLLEGIAANTARQAAASEQSAALLNQMLEMQKRAMNRSEQDA